MVIALCCHEQIVMVTVVDGRQVRPALAEPDNANGRRATMARMRASAWCSLDLNVMQKSPVQNGGVHIFALDGHRFSCEYSPSHTESLGEV